MIGGIDNGNGEQFRFGALAHFVRTTKFGKDTRP